MKIGIVTSLIYWLRRYWIIVAIGLAVLIVGGNLIHNCGINRGNAQLKKIEAKLEVEKVQLNLEIKNKDDEIDGILKRSTGTIFKLQNEIESLKIKPVKLKKYRPFDLSKYVPAPEFNKLVVDYNELKIEYEVTIEQNRIFADSSNKKVAGLSLEIKALKAELEKMETAYQKLYVNSQQLANSYRVRYKEMYKRYPRSPVRFGLGFSGGYNPFTKSWSAVMGISFVVDTRIFR